MTLDEIRAFVRGFPDIDSSDLPNSVLDPIISDQAYRIASAERTWDFYEVSYSFATVAGTQAYSLDSLGTYPVRDVSHVQGPTFTLRPAAHQALQMKYPNPSTTATYPRSWSKWNRSLYLWPKPSSMQTHTLWGYRDPIDWVSQGAGAEPDLPTEFHMIVAKLALSVAYIQQDDFYASDVLQREANTELANLRTRFIGEGPQGPIVLGGGNRDIGLSDGAALFPWEQ